MSPRASLSSVVLLTLLTHGIDACAPRNGCLACACRPCNPAWHGIRALGLRRRSEAGATVSARRYIHTRTRPDEQIDPNSSRDELEKQTGGVRACDGWCRAGARAAASSLFAGR